MAWSLYRWVWQVEAPLHIGMAPAGMLNRTRLYVPSRALWGALTAELARLGAQGFPEYEKVGAELREKTRLGYLYPAKAVNGQWMAWLPRYAECGVGLVWKREDGRAEDRRAKGEGERKFRMRLLITRPGTAIEPESASAAEGTLREFELISPYWRGDGTLFQRVALVGYIFCKDAAPELKPIQTLWVGGDARYGLGRLERVAWKPADSFFGEPVDLQGKEPVVKTSRVLAHTYVSTGGASLVGAMERLGGWDMPKGGLTIQELTWVPGSVSKNPQDFVIQEDGLWRMR
ncbi:MAG: hypothetical protein ACK4ZX_08530 [Thermus sp.]